ncbi:MAG: type II secretion system F family protein, partial [Gemmatimonadaceae bacterium]
ELLLWLPLLGSYRQSAATARTAASLAALLESGVPLAAALPHAARACGDAAISVRLLAARSAIMTGVGVAAAFAAANALTPTGVRLAKAGEETGRLGAMLAHAARIEDDHASTLLRSAVRLLEPGLILFFGGVIALVAAALLQAVYAVRPAP